MTITINQLNSVDQKSQLYGNLGTSGGLAGTQNHPFNYAYGMQNRHDIDVVLHAYDWVAGEYGVCHPMPDVLVVNHDHMQRAAITANHHTAIVGQVVGWYSQPFGKVFVSDRIRPSKSKLAVAFLVHEFVHWFQHICDNTSSIVAMEHEADMYMTMYLNQMC